MILSLSPFISVIFFFFPLICMFSKGIDSSETMIMELERDLDNLLWVVLFAYGLNFLFH